MGVQQLEEQECDVIHNQHARKNGEGDRVSWENLPRAQQQLKQWYDRNARTQEFKTENMVLVLLPTSSSKLLAQWQGPYQIEKIGEVNMWWTWLTKESASVSSEQWHTPVHTNYYRYKKKTRMMLWCGTKE